ncbi:MAG: hypothetical protein JWP02_3271 [Acidimicrobiales bacterium]|nr:hypothetical protein [Acidimicrobiales bacterium]
MTAGPEPSAGSGWTRLPRWQHGLLIAFCTAGLVAAVANVAAASSNGSRALHAAFGLFDGAVLVSLVLAYRRRPAE